MRAVLKGSDAWAADLAARLLAPGLRRCYTFVGAGPSLGVAYTGMALLAKARRSWRWRSRSRSSTTACISPQSRATTWWC